MLTLEEIYNKYLTMDRIEDDPIIEKLFNDFSPKSEEFLSAEYINTVINNPLINKQELKKLYKPGIPIIPIDRFDFSILLYEISIPASYSNLISCKTLSPLLNIKVSVYIIIY